LEEREKEWISSQESRSDFSKEQTNLRCWLSFSLNCTRWNIL